MFKAILAGLCISTIVFIVDSTTYAQPYGQAKYSANVPYGGQTQLSIATSGNLALSMTPTGSTTLGSVSGTVTVTNSDVSGYRLYVRALNSSNMVNGSAILGASSNVSAAALAANTWGFNLDSSTNFMGLSTSDTLIKSTSNPATTGDTSTVTYGVNVDSTQPAGVYTSTVLYTAVPRTN